MGDHLRLISWLHPVCVRENSPTALSGDSGILDHSLGLQALELPDTGELLLDFSGGFISEDCGADSRSFGAPSYYCCGTDTRASTHGLPKISSNIQRLGSTSHPCEPHKLPHSTRTRTFPYFRGFLTQICCTNIGNLLVFPCLLPCRVPFVGLFWRFSLGSMKVV